MLTQVRAGHNVSVDDIQVYVLLRITQKKERVKYLCCLLVLNSLCLFRSQRVEVHEEKQDTITVEVELRYNNDKHEETDTMQYRTKK